MSIRGLSFCLANFVGLTFGFCSPSIVAGDTPQSLPAVPNEGEVRIAVVQQKTVPGDVVKNRNSALRFAEEALHKNPDIILFHEAVTVGYVANLGELAESVDGPTTQAFKALLEEKKSNALILYGLIEKDRKGLYTSATLVSHKGVVANYRKTHLWWADGGLRHEPTFFLPGNQLVTFEVKGNKCGVMICYDGDFPEMTRAYANMDCTMLFWLNNRQSRGHSEVRQLASRNSMIMATSCVCGIDEGGRQCRGGSNVTDQDGDLITEIWDVEGVIYADVAPTDVLEARQRNPWYRGQRTDLYR